MKIRESLGVKVFRVCNAIFLTLLCCVTLYPIIHVFMAAFSDGNELLAHRGLLLWPLSPNVGAFKKVFEGGEIFTCFGNTIIIYVVSLVINMVMTTIAAYFLTRKEALGRKTIMTLIMVTMYFGGGLVPSYLVVKSLGMLDTFWAVIIPSAIGTYNMIVLRTAFAAVPDSLYEAARIDGAGHFRILIQIMLPLTKATLAVIVLYYLVGHWNNWFSASIYITDRKLYPLTLYLREKLISGDMSGLSGGEMMLDSDEQSIKEVLKYAIIVVSTVPILCVYPLLQKYFAKGVMIGAVKG